jgi:hypothetical protein
MARPILIGGFRASSKERSCAVLDGKEACLCGPLR